MADAGSSTSEAAPKSAPSTSQAARQAAPSASQPIPTRRPRILLAATGCVAATRFANLCRCFTQYGDVAAITTQNALPFIDRTTIPNIFSFFIDAAEWSIWKKLGDPVIHIELSRWADMMIIAPLSANTLAKIANGLCDNILTCTVRAWDYRKPMFVAPAMNSLTWDNPFTKKHLKTVEDLGIIMITKNTKTGKGVMAENDVIYNTVRLYYEKKVLGKVIHA